MFMVVNKDARDDDDEDYGDDDDHDATMELYTGGNPRRVLKSLNCHMVSHMARGCRTLIMTLQSHHHASNTLVQMEKLRNIPKRLNKLNKDYFCPLSGTRNTLPLLVSMTIVM